MDYAAAALALVRFEAPDHGDVASSAARARMASWSGQSSRLRVEWTKAKSRACAACAPVSIAPVSDRLGRRHCRGVFIYRETHVCIYIYTLMYLCVCVREREGEQVQAHPRTKSVQAGLRERQRSFAPLGQRHAPRKLSSLSPTRA